jgi:hypothetical protein
MKKVLAIGMPILLIIGGLVLLYIFVLQGLIDPPPDVVMGDVIEAAQQLNTSQTETNEDRFRDFFSDRCQEGLLREWNAQSLDGSRRGSWFELAIGLLNVDGTRPEIVRFELAAAEEGEEEAEGEPEKAVVFVKIDRVEREIPMIREEGGWRIDIQVHPTSTVVR